MVVNSTRGSSCSMPRACRLPGALLPSTSTWPDRRRDAFEGPAGCALVTRRDERRDIQFPPQPPAVATHLINPFISTARHTSAADANGSKWVAVVLLGRTTKRTWRVRLPALTHDRHHVCEGSGNKSARINGAKSAVPQPIPRATKRPNSSRKSIASTGRESFYQRC